jgi:hypothetical protein
VHDPLGSPGRARCVEDGRREHRDLAAHLVHHGSVDDLLVVVADHDRGARRARAVHLLGERPFVLGAQIGVGDEHPGLGVLEDVGELVGLQVPVDEDDLGAELRRREPRFDELDAVGQEDCHPVAAADSPRGERRRQALGAGVQSAERPDLVAAHERRFVGCRGDPVGDAALPHRAVG